MSTATSRRRAIASYDDYADAQRAVDTLSDGGFPVERVSIVGDGLKYVEQVSGRMTTGRAALMGALNGGLIGAVLGLLAGWIFTVTDPAPVVAVLVLYGLAAGAILGGIVGALAHAMTGGRRDFASVAGMTASRYQVLVDEDVADRATELLRGGATSASAAV